MGKRVFLVGSEWSFDHANKEYGTFTIEGGEKEEKDLSCNAYIGDALTPENFKDYWDIHGSTIATCVEKIVSAQNGNVDDRRKPVNLYVVTHLRTDVLGAINEQQMKLGGYVILEFKLVLLCRLNSKGEIIV